MLPPVIYPSMSILSFCVVSISWVLFATVLWINVCGYGKPWPRSGKCKRLILCRIISLSELDSEIDSMLAGQSKGRHSDLGELV